MRCYQNLGHQSFCRSKQRRRPGMETLVNFFALRSMFTIFGIRIVWYIYLASVIVQTYTSVFGVSRVLAQRGIGLEAWLPNAIPLALTIVSQLVLVRLFLELAAIVISDPRK